MSVWAGPVSPSVRPCGRALMTGEDDMAEELSHCILSERQVQVSLRSMQGHGFFVLGVTEG